MKTRILCCLILLITIGSVATAQCPDGTLPTAFINWAQFRFEPTHQGCNPYEFVLGTGNVGNLGIKWKSTLFAGTNNGSPTVANGMVYRGSLVPRKGVTNADIIRMMKAGIPDNIIVRESRYRRRI